MGRGMVGGSYVEGGGDLLAMFCHGWKGQILILLIPKDLILRTKAVSLLNYHNCWGLVSFSAFFRDDQMIRFARSDIFRVFPQLCGKCPRLGVIQLRNFGERGRRYAGAR